MGSSDGHSGPVGAVLRDQSDRHRRLASANVSFPSRDSLLPFPRVPVSRVDGPLDRKAATDSHGSVDRGVPDIPVDPTDATNLDLIRPLHGHGYRRGDLIVGPDRGENDARRGRALKTWRVTRDGRYLGCLDAKALPREDGGKGEDRSEPDWAHRRDYRRRPLAPTASCTRAPVAGRHRGERSRRRAPRASHAAKALAHARHTLRQKSECG
jgi:hypothetical protein